MPSLYRSLLLLALGALSVNAGVVLRRQDLDPESSVYKLLASNSTIYLPDLTVALVNTTTTDVRGDVPDTTDLKVDVLSSASSSLTAEDFIEPTVSDEALVFSVSSVTTSAITAADVSATNTFLFSVTLPVFLAAKAAGVPTTLDWSDDGCSYSPDRPAGFNFLDSCKRHDFGYRNFKAQNRLTDANRLAIDNNFKKDLYNECGKQGFLKQGVCEGIADVYYEAVRAFGGL
ncbi:phospholipase A2 group [Morchella snyderi]|nr:phospholipase A2 group [Morchella snyderi]